MSTSNSEAPKLLSMALPDELITEILSCLPVKSLIRLKCVSQHWKSVIDNPSFIKFHLQKSSRNSQLTLMMEYRSRGIIHGYDVEVSLVHFPLRQFLENPSNTVTTAPCFPLKCEGYSSLVGSCNGLLCLLGFYFSTDFQDYWLSMWNPATGLSSEKEAIFRVSRDYPLRRNYPLRIFNFAFGYDNLSQSYKVVAFRMEDETTFEMKICSFSDCCWRDLSSFPGFPIIASNGGANNGVYLNGTINWVSLRNPISFYGSKALINPNQLVIDSLHLGNEMYTQLLLPPGFGEVPCDDPNLGVLMDCLCLSNDSNGTHLAVWIMKEFGVETSWSRFLNVSYQNLQVDRVNWQNNSALLPLCVSQNGDVVVLANSHEKQAIIYNRADNSVEQTAITKSVPFKTNISIPLSWNSAKDYVESLISPC